MAIIIKIERVSFETATEHDYKIHMSTRTYKKITDFSEMKKYFSLCLYQSQLKFSITRKHSTSMLSDRPGINASFQHYHVHITTFFRI